MNANKNNGKRVSNSVSGSDLAHNFFFIKPEKDTSADDLANRLLGIGCLEEVRVKQGTIGYNVFAKFDDESYSKVASAMPKMAGYSYGKFVSAMNLKKAMK